MDLYAEIIVDNNSTETDILYTYRIPIEIQDDLKIGMRVIVPFGIGNMLLQGLVIKIKSNIDFNKNKLKDIVEVVDKEPILSSSLIELGLWMRREYLAQYIEVFKTIMPTGITKKVKQYIYLVDENINITNIKSKNQNKIIKFLFDNNGIEFEELKKVLKISNINSSVKSLKSKGIIKVENKIEQDINKKYEKVVVKLFKNLDIPKILNRLNKLAKKQRQVILFLKDYKEIKLKDLTNLVGSSYSTIRALESKNLISIIDKESPRQVLDKNYKKTENMELNKEQTKCYNIINKSISSEKSNKFLIHGVTGSGKTEVYIQLIENVIKKQKQAIVLIPEISLTPQTVERFVSRFDNNVAVLHSGLSLGERYDEWRKIKEGKVDIVIGARSAIFAPFKNLGIIIIDEEHENSYKSSINPKYDTIKVAEKRSELESAILVLGSATPSINTYYLAEMGKYELLQMNKRANKQEMPNVDVIDMREELENGNKTIFSTRLYNDIITNLKDERQIILFLNRRGFSTFISCRECGYVEKCPSCDVSLTFHKKKNWLKCHYCGFAKKPVEVCPKCESKYIRYFGIGTQKVEEMVKKTFENINVERMDIDTTSKKNSHEEILNRFKNREIDILIGTQMISKGLDFPNVLLVGVIAADLTLNLPDYRASERTFQLLTQVAGRSGRGERKGNVVVQTYDPNHYSIIYARSHDYIGFYKEEIKLRKIFNYPPFVNIISIVFSGLDVRELESITKHISDAIIKNIRYKNKDFDVSNNISKPMPSPIPKIKNKYRWQMIIKASDGELKVIKNIIYWVCIKNKYNIPIDKIKISIDINPNSIM
ncbi:primosomal protein N' [Senegalia massiliensis]|uniref:primosomal protein N' n=1 Tax=Senegalia massiliensis TaxID=1720316 RepID=UPI001A922FAF|nr:primosomal protein N' [Senegalia massiliensis]